MNSQRFVYVKAFKGKGGPEGLPSSYGRKLDHVRLPRRQQTTGNLRERLTALGLRHVAFLLRRHAVALVRHFGLKVDAVPSSTQSMQSAVGHSAVRDLASSRPYYPIAAGDQA